MKLVYLPRASMRDPKESLLLSGFSFLGKGTGLYTSLTFPLVLLQTTKPQIQTGNAYKIHDLFFA